MPKPDRKKPTPTRKFMDMYRTADFFGEKKSFHIKGKGSFKSTTGASISILLRILMLTILIKKTIDLVTKVDYQFYEIVKRQGLEKDRVFK